MRFLLFLALLLPVSVYAQEFKDIPAVCGPEKYMFERTQELGYGNKIIFTGVSEVNPNVATQVIVDEERGTFTILNWYPTDGIVCVFNNGINYVTAWQKSS
jgi:hypothetical protein